MIPVIDWQTLPRPDRSGLLGAVLAVSMLYSTVTAMNDGDCFVLCGEESSVQAAPLSRPRKDENIRWLPPGDGPADGDSCHFDVRVKGDAAIIHLPPHELVCDHTTEWEKPFTYGADARCIFMSDVAYREWMCANIEFRYHVSATKPPSALGSRPSPKQHEK
jgi:hypothetical protein